MLNIAPPPDYRPDFLAKVPALASSRRAALIGAAKNAVVSVVPGDGRATTRKDDPDQLSPSLVRGLPKIALTTTVKAADASHASAYARIVGAAGTDQLPAGYLHVLGFPLTMSLLTAPRFPLRALGMVHIENRIRLSRPSLFGETWTITAWADHLRPHRRGALVDIHLTATSERAPDDGDVVWHGISTYLATGVTVPGEPADFTATWDTASHELDGVHSWTLPADLGRRYAEISGDANPIHTSLLGARAFGFSRPIAHGMYTAARSLSEVHSPEGGTVDWQVRFAKPVPLPSRPHLEYVRRAERTDFALLGERKAHLVGSVSPLQT